MRIEVAADSTKTLTPHRAVRGDNLIFPAATSLTCGVFYFMPNHIQNRLTVNGSKSDVKNFLDFISSEEDGEKIQIDFNKIKPMPESLNITSGSLGEMAHSLLFGTKKEKFFSISTEENQKRFTAMDIERQKEAVLLAIQYQDNLVKYGATTWYDWAIENWGTKWNAYEQNDKRNKENTIFFQTAWSAPVKLICEVSKKFPELEILFTYADEDAGTNTGNLKILAGEIISCEQPKSQSKEGYDIYFELHPDSRKYYKIVGDSYEYIDE